MEKPSSTATPSTKAKLKDVPMNFSGFALIDEDLLHNILARLPALSFSSAACVSKLWNRVCDRILSRPRLASVLSLNPSLPVAIKEVLDKVLSEPIRPHFAIASVGNESDVSVTLQLITERLGSSIPVIVSEGYGIIGRDAFTNEVKEVQWVINEEPYVRNIHSGIVLTVGFFPGLKVEAIPILPSTETTLVSAVDNFVADIKEYTSSFTGCTSPVGIIMFGDHSRDLKLVMEMLDYAMPLDTAIVGDEKGYFKHRSRSSKYACNTIKYLAVALVFVQERDRSAGQIKFHVALSNGLLPVGSRYKAVSIRTTDGEASTFLTARREGQQEILDGQSMLGDINNELANCIESPDLYLGVTKHRKFSIGSEKPRPRRCISFHAVIEGDDEYLYVEGAGIRTGDVFQFYHSDPDTALASSTEVYDKLKNLKLEGNSRSKGDANNAVNVIGGFIFACCGRGESFFGRTNVDSSPFWENFPGVPLAGIFCGGEIGRPPSCWTGQGPVESSISRSVHAYSTVYLVMSHTQSLEY